MPRSHFLSVPLLAPTHASFRLSLQQLARARAISQLAADCLKSKPWTGLQVAARYVGINLLASLKVELGDLDKIKRIVKIVGCCPTTARFAPPRRHFPLPPPPANAALATRRRRPRHRPTAAATAFCRPPPPPPPPSPLPLSAAICRHRHSCLRTASCSESRTFGQEGSLV